MLAFPGSLQKVPRCENRALLDLAHRVEYCVNCFRFVATGCVPAHSNLQRHGRGESYKSHDHHHAALCPLCHDWLDKGMRKPDPTGIWLPTREDKEQFFIVMRDRTYDVYFTNGWIGVLR